MEHDGELEIAYGFFNDVESIDFFPAEPWLDDSVIEVTMKDQSWFSLYLSTGEGGDIRFHDRLVRMWKQKRGD